MRPIHLEFYVLKVLITWISVFKKEIETRNTLFFIATGEPPLCMSVSVLFALRNAVDAARIDAGNSGWYRMGKFKLWLQKDYKNASTYVFVSHLDGPATIDKLHKMMLTNSAQYLFQ